MNRDNDSNTGQNDLDLDTSATNDDMKIKDEQLDSRKSIDHNDDHEKNTVGEGVDFKSPNEFAVPLSISAPKPKKDRAIAQPEVHAENVDEISVQRKNKESEHPDSHKQHISIPYKVPDWSGIAEDDYNFDVLKNGSIIGTVSLSTKPFHVFGRLPSCDVTLEHPSLSRYHAVVQYCATSTPQFEKGWYIFDLDSTHGTWVNKKKMSPKVYHRLKVGHIVKFGGSSRLHILQGPSEDQEEESEMTITEMKEQKEKLRKEAELLRQVELQEEMQRRDAEQKMLEDRGCGWGMDEDADDVEGENPYATLVPENESLYIDDPKKALKGFYEREGCDLPDYQFTEVAMGKHKCRLELPVDGPNGEELVAEVVVSGKRKDAVIACALEACRMLDKLGMLRSSTHESRKRKQKKWEDNDFYDSDEDTFLDRTGTIEKKRVLRMKKAGKDEPETYESLLDKYNQVVKQIEEIEDKLQKAKAEAESRASQEMDELDAYMASIKQGAMDTKTRMQLKGDLMKLKAEEQKLRKLVNIAQPPSLPPLKPPSSKPPDTALVPAADALSRKLHATQRQQHKKPTLPRPAAPIVVEEKPDNYEEEDEEEEDEEDRMESSKNCQTESVMSSKDKASDRVKVKGPAQPLKSTEGIIKGPSFPSPFKSVQKDEIKSVSSRASHQRSIAAVLSKLENTGSDKGKKSKQVTDSNFETSDPDYAMWLPPEGECPRLFYGISETINSLFNDIEQSGDGRTSLNDKLGY